jgi:hypothetical protein
MRVSYRMVWMGMAALALGCKSSDECKKDTSYNPIITPADFVAAIDNPFWPLTPGTVYRYQSDTEVNLVTVTSDTKVILGVTCTVVHDVVTVDGATTEDTYDWYAQDKDGNVWYMGEDTKEYSGGVVVSTEGSWEAGVDGAKPGIVMYGTLPAQGWPYRQEYYACEAEDMAEVVATDVSVTVPYGTFDHCLQTREFTRLEPDVNEFKVYAPGVGLVLEVEVASGARTELTEVTGP